MTTNGAVTAQAGHEPKKRPRFADGGQARLPLSEGDWVAVRKELTYGQQRRLTFAGLTGVPAALAEQGQGRQLTMDMATYHVERLVTWVLDWSFTGEDGAPVYVSREAIEALHPDTAAEIDAALDAHIADLEAKKGGPSPGAPPGATTSAATSPSAARSAGAGRR